MIKMHIRRLIYNIGPSHDSNLLYGLVNKVKEDIGTRDLITSFYILLIK